MTTVTKKCPHCGYTITMTLEELQEIVAQDNMHNHCIKCEAPDDQPYLPGMEEVGEYE